MLAMTFTWTDLAYLALSVFLLALGIAGAYALWRLGGTFKRLSSLIAGTEREVLPVVEKVGGTVDRVNAELDKVGVMTDSAVDAVDSADTAVRAVSWAVTKPVQEGERDRHGPELRRLDAREAARLAQRGAGRQGGRRQARAGAGRGAPPQRVGAAQAGARARARSPSPERQ